MIVFETIWKNLPPVVLSGNRIINKLDAKAIVKESTDV